LYNAYGKCLFCAFAVGEDALIIWKSLGALQIVALNDADVYRMAVLDKLDHRNQVSEGGLEGRNGGEAAISSFQPDQYSECVGGRACRDLRQFAMHPSH
jgi:hypothetical protein